MATLRLGPLYIELRWPITIRRCEHAQLWFRTDKSKLMYTDGAGSTTELRP